MNKSKRTSRVRFPQIAFGLLSVSLVATVVARRIVHASLLFAFLVCMDLFLAFCCLVLLQVTWQFRRPAKNHQAQLQPVASSPAPLFPLTLDRLLRFAPDEFEEFIGIVLEAMGMEYTQVQRIGGSGDQGADLIARNTFQLRIIVQCKRYAPGNRVDSPDLQRFLGSITHYRALYGWFVTTSTFTQPALDFASANAERIRLLDGEQLIALIHQRQREMLLVWQQRKSQSQTI